jgi:hypothetical protein
MTIAPDELLPEPGGGPANAIRQVRDANWRPVCPGIEFEER